MTSFEASTSEPARNTRRTSGESDPLRHQNRRSYLWRVQRISTSGEVRDTRIYTRRGAAVSKAQRWQDYPDTGSVRITRTADRVIWQASA